MLESIQVVGGSVLTLFLLMAVGFFMGKRALLSPQALSQLSTLLLYIVCPIIMINTFLEQDHTSRTVRMLLVAGMVMVGTYVLNMILIPIFFRRTPRAERGVMQFSAIYGNIGFMGIPLISAVLGPEGMLVTVTGLAMFNISVWTHGAFLMGGRAEVSLKKALLNPGTIGFLVAIVLFGLHVELPGPVTDALGYIGDLNTPLAMVVVGAQMAAVDLPSLFRDRRVYGVTAVKLLLIPAVTMLVLLPFGLDRVTYTAAVILSGCPVAGTASLFCQLTGKDTGLAARFITLSTLLCIVTLPLTAMVAELLL